MFKKYCDEKFNFNEIFDTKTGFYMRTGVIENGKDTGVDPFMRSFPQLLDIGIMGSCVHGRSGLCAKSGVQCYQNGLKTCEPDMTLENFKKIVDECKGKTFQCLDEKEVVLIRDKQTGTTAIKYMKDVDVTDEVYVGKNNFAKITSVNKKTVPEIYQINFNYGKSILATGEHKFPVGETLKTVQELVVGDILPRNQNFDLECIRTIDVVKLLINKGLDSDFCIIGDIVPAICKRLNIKYNWKGPSVRLSKIKDVVFDYDYSTCLISRERSQYTFDAVYPITSSLMTLLGHYIGNGSKRSYVISKTQTKMIQQIEESLQNNFPNFSYSKRNSLNTIIIEIKSTLLHKVLFDELLCCRTCEGEKQLPNILMNLSTPLKVSFLRGYFCDGNLRLRNSDGIYGDIVFNTSSHKLSQDIGLLLSSLNVNYDYVVKPGGLATFSKNDQRIINRKDRYRIKVSNLIELLKIKDCVTDHKDYDRFKIVFDSEHEQKYLRSRDVDCRIVSIERIIEPHNVVDINVSTDERLFVTSHGIITHNCALGGRGDVDQHDDFEEILKYCVDNNIVPNFTSSGLGFNEHIVELCKKFCGAVAISWYRNKFTSRAIQMLLNAGVKTNIHYVLGNNTIDEAIERVENNDFPKGINAVVFLLHKPVGMGREENVLQSDDARVAKFFNLIDTAKVDFKIGFDSCTIPGLINFTKNINPDSFDSCEGGRFSAYITSDMKMLPCSFDNQELNWAYDISNDSVQKAWDSPQFEDFRNHFRGSCQSCKDRHLCLGGCPIRRSTVLCDREEKKLA